MFINPLGYDLVIFYISKLTHDYWTTVSIMYVLTAIFFSGFLFLYKINPLNNVKEFYKKIKYGK